MSKHKQMGKKGSDDEEALRRSEERLHLILESAQGFAIFTTDTDGTINSWYAGAAQVFEALRVCIQFPHRSDGTGGKGGTL